MYRDRPYFRFSLATLLIFTAIVCVAIGMPHLTLAVASSGSIVLSGAAVIAIGWRAKRYRIVARIGATAFGLVTIVAGVWVFWIGLPG